MLDSLADIKIIIMNRYQQWRANPFVQVQAQHSWAAPAFNLSPQTSAFRRSVYSNETNTLSPFSTRSSPWMCTSIRSRGHRLPPYGQSSHEGDRAQHEHVLGMPEVVEEPGTLSSLGLIGVLSLESSESSTSTILAESPPPPSIPSPYIPSPYVPSPYVPPQERRDPGIFLHPRGPRGQFAYATRAVW